MPINYKEYHPDWKNISKFIRHERAENKCEWCGAVNHKPHPVTGSQVVLTVAHIDHNKKNNNYKNLAALCQRCHLNHDRKHHVSNRKYGKKHRGRHQLKLNF